MFTLYRRALSRVKLFFKVAPYWIDDKVAWFFSSSNEQDKYLWSAMDGRYQLLYRCLRCDQVMSVYYYLDSCRTCGAPPEFRARIIAKWNGKPPRGLYTYPGDWTIRPSQEEQEDIRTIKEKESRQRREQEARKQAEERYQRQQSQEKTSSSDPFEDLLSAAVGEYFYHCVQINLEEYKHIRKEMLKIVHPDQGASSELFRFVRSIDDMALSILKKRKKA